MKSPPWFLLVGGLAGACAFTAVCVLIMPLPELKETFVPCTVTQTPKVTNALPEEPLFIQFRKEAK